VIDTGETAPGILSIPSSPFPTDNIFHVISPQQIRQSALFGNAAYEVLDRVKLTLGGRYFSFRNRIDATDSGIGSPSGNDTPTLSAGAASASGFNPMVNIAYTATSNLMYYATAAKGFREGAGNFPVPTTGPVGEVCLQNLQAIGRTSAPLLYDPDQVWSYELGEKGRFLDQRVTLNADAYLLRWTKVQQPVSLPCGLTFVENAGEADVKGGELELRALLAPQLTLTQTVGYSSAHFTQDVPEANVVKGQALLNVPRWTVSTELHYEHPLFDDLRGTVTATNSYVSSQHDLTYSLNTLPARDLVGARVGIEGKAWSVELYADNLLNRRYPLEYINLLSFTGPPYNRIVSNQPLTFGLSLNLRY
jgi:iron complex outermembrane recepter protein